jgi:serine/threonine-protein kinase
MSRVYRATQRSLRRQGCVKILRDELADEPGLAERFQDEGIALATDLYAVGIVLFELITGRRPFVARDELEMAQLTTLTSPPKLGAFIDEAVPPALDQLVLERLAKNLADRPASAAATRDRLLAVLAEPLRPTG